MSNECFGSTDLTRTYTQDGVCLTESGLSQLQSLANAASRRRRSKPKLKLKIINQNSVAVLQTPPDPQTEASRNGDLEDIKSTICYIPLNPSRVSWGIRKKYLHVTMLLQIWSNGYDLHTWDFLLSCLAGNLRDLVSVQNISMAFSLQYFLLYLHFTVCVQHQQQTGTWLMVKWNQIPVLKEKLQQTMTLKTQIPVRRGRESPTAQVRARTKAFRCNMSAFIR